MWKKIKGVAIFVGVIVAGIFAFIFLEGRTGKGDSLLEEAKRKREKADLIDAEIARLKAERGKIDEETKREIERIKKLDSLEEISDALNRL